MVIIVARNEGRAAVELCKTNGWGRMYITRTPKPYPDEPWAWDNGAYQAYCKGEPLNIEKWKRRTELATRAGTPYMCVLPDIVAGGHQSLELSITNIQYVPPQWPKYLAVQDGITSEDVLPYLPFLDGIFLGGSTAYKTTAAAWADFAHQHGKKFHYARASTRRKLQDAMQCNADSIDTACPLWIPRQLRQFTAWCNELKYQPQLFGGTQ